MIGAAFEPLLVVEDDGQLEAHPALGLGPAALWSGFLASVVVVPQVVGNSPTIKGKKKKYFILTSRNFFLFLMNKKRVYLNHY